MKNILSFLLLLTFVCKAGAQSAQQPKVIELWPSGKPNTNGIDHLPEDIEARNFAPTLYLYLPEKGKANGMAVVACPGGGYGHLALSHEGHDWAPYFNAQGIAYGVLKYRLPKGNREVPMSDAQEAIRLMRANAEEWNIKPEKVGIMGSSAGGHLASTVATHAAPAVRPNFQILFYPVVSLENGVTHKGTRVNFLGNEPQTDLVADYSNANMVKKGETPPAILLLSDDDKVVIPKNSIEYYSALQAEGIPAALHIYPKGGHGWGSRPTFAYHKAMINDLTDRLDVIKAE